MKTESSWLWKLAMPATLVALAALFWDTSSISRERDERLQANREHCERNRLVYVQKDAFDTGSCMTMEEAAKALGEIQRETVNRGLK